MTKSLPISKWMVYNSYLKVISKDGSAGIVFHNSSFGYRPGRSAHQAIEQCQANTREYAWVIDMDIKGFFDNISHDIMLQFLQPHTQEKWVLLYAERWLKAGV
jgi:RNA-directed DNA polymerase